MSTAAEILSSNPFKVNLWLVHDDFPRKTDQIPLSRWKCFNKNSHSYLFN